MTVLVPNRSAKALSKILLLKAKGIAPVPRSSWQASDPTEVTEDVVPCVLGVTRQKSVWPAGDSSATA